MTNGVRLSYDEVNKAFEERNMTLISTEYKNAHTPLEYVCQKHPEKGIQKIKYTDIKRHKTKCPYCMYEEGHPPNHLPENIYQKVTEDNGYQYISLRRDKQTTIIQFICPEHSEYGLQESNWGSMSQGKTVCKYCNGTGRTTEMFKKEIANMFPNLQILNDYTGAKNRIKVKCLKHKFIWEPLAYNLLSGYGCPKCGHERTGLSERTSSEEKINKFYSVRDDAILLSEPILTSDIVKCQCKVCGNVWEATYSNLVNPNLLTGCPNCVMSKGEKEIKRILDKWHINYITQKTFSDCKNINVLPFDFYLPDSNVCIEYQGIQHYRPVDAFGGEKEFIEVKRRDKIKKNYCINNNIPLIELEDLSIDEIEDYLFDEFCKYGVLKLISA